VEVTLKITIIFDNSNLNSNNDMKLQHIFSDEF
jgi:hypothetical protein